MQKGKSQLFCLLLNSVIVGISLFGLKQNGGRWFQENITSLPKWKEGKYKSLLGSSDWQRPDSDLIGDEQQARLPPTPTAFVPPATFLLFRSEDIEWVHMFSPIMPYSSPVSCCVLKECCSGPSLATLIRLTCPDAVSSNVLHVCCHRLPRCRVTVFHLSPSCFPQLCSQHLSIAFFAFSGLLSV